jgi:tripartite-type tricarboxylate transporter receptor subunit TctC
MPLALRNRIATDIRTELEDPQVSAKLSATGQVVNPGTPADFAAALDAQRATVASIGKVLGIKPAQ